jgi:3-dehydroquinate synthase
MDLIEHTIQVSWPHRVFFTDHLFDPANSLLKDILTDRPAGEPGKVLVVLDETLAAARPGLAEAITSYFVSHPEGIRLVCRPFVQPGGEAAKNSWDNVSELHRLVEQYHVDRHSYLIAVGGGALLDVAGLAAATAHRGVRHVRIPTTTLAQCDSGVGVKNGINAFGKKNFLGTFAPPFAVINDFQLLATLAPRDKRAGCVEAVKVACIRDRRFFETLENDAAGLHQLEQEPLRRLIRRCAELHLDHIVQSGDPFESGSARPLDFGHWAAHKLEQLSRFRLRHGEAVAVGLALDTVYSRRCGYLDAQSAERVLRLLEALGLSLFAPELILTGLSRDLLVLEGIEEFREHLGGRLAVTLLRAIGSGFEVQEMNAALIQASIQELQARHTVSESRELLVGA